MTTGGGQKEKDIRWSEKKNPRVATCNDIIVNYCPPQFIIRDRR